MVSLANLLQIVDSGTAASRDIGLLMTNQHFWDVQHRWDGSRKMSQKWWLFHVDFPCWFAVG